MYVALSIDVSLDILGIRSTMALKNVKSICKLDVVKFNNLENLWNYRIISVVSNMENMNYLSNKTS
jgi:hypothetical protein